MPNTIKSKQPRKQRKARFNAPHHAARKQMASHLSEELLVKYNRRNLTVVKGDEVKVMRGDFAGTIGKVSAIDVSRRKVFVDGVINKKADGTEVGRIVDPSNLLIVKLNLEDKYRRAKIGEGGEEKAEKPAAKKAAPKSKAPAKAEPKAAAKAERKVVEAVAQ